MPAGLPDESAVNNAANPNAGRCVLFSNLSGPKGSLFDKDNTGNASTGQLSNCIGFGAPPIFDVIVPNQQFNDDYTVGLTKPDRTSSANSTIMFIGGGKSTAAALPTGAAPDVPYTAGFAVGKAGQGGSRDAGAGPAFTSFAAKTVTAAATIANGAVVEAGWVNRSGVSITNGQSIFGSASAASAAPA